MKIIEPYIQFMTPINRNQVLELIEHAARTCYKSECKAVPGKAGEFVRKIAQVKKHESVIEHASATVKFVCDRGVSHELVRHRLSSFSQESTRYCNYASDKFGGELTFVQNSLFPVGSQLYAQWIKACRDCENAYLGLLHDGATPEAARSVLIHSIKTEVVVTSNMRQWRHLLRLRCSKTAHPQIRQLAIPVLKEFQKHLPELFDDIEYTEPNTI